MSLVPEKMIRIEVIVLASLTEVQVINEIEVKVGLMSLVPEKMIGIEVIVLASLTAKVLKEVT